MYFFRSAFPGWVLAALLALGPGCQDSPPSAVPPSAAPQAAREAADLERRLAAFEQYYQRIQCVKEALAGLELLDNCLDYGVSLERYQLNIVSARTRLEVLNCHMESQAALNAILDYHLLASRFWQGRNQGQAGELAAEFIGTVWPLWRQFGLAPPGSFSQSLLQNLDQYGQAAGPAAHQTLNQITLALNSPDALPVLAQEANQALWHQAHRQLELFREKLLTGPDLLGSQ
jgi:hypothetical protein